MPRHPDGTHQQSAHGLSVTARTLPGDDCRLVLCLAGEIDMASSDIAFNAVDWLAALAPVSVLVDLADLTFASATLAHFVVRVRHTVPDGAELILWRARPATGRVLQATGMAAIATIRTEPAELLANLV